MTLNEYQIAMGRTTTHLTPAEKLKDGLYGINGEAGECIDLLKKHEFQGHELDPMELLDELGDVLWYVAQVATGLGVALEEVARHNLNKSYERYPDGFDVNRSIHRPEYEREVNNGTC